MWSLPPFNILGNILETQGIILQNLSHLKFSDINPFLNNTVWLSKLCFNLTLYFEFVQEIMFEYEIKLLSNQEHFSLWCWSVFSQVLWNRVYEYISYLTCSFKMILFILTCLWILYFHVVWLSYTPSYMTVEFLNKLIKYNFFSLISLHDLLVVY